MRKKRCPKCDRDKPIGQFYKNKLRKDGRQVYCKACIKGMCNKLAAADPLYFAKVAKRYRRRNVDKCRQRQRARRYGITVEQVIAFEKAADGRCQICGKKGKLSLDHCHKSAVVRGLLCRRCNQVLGHCGDDTELLQKMIDYLTARFSPSAGAIVS